MQETRKLPDPTAAAVATWLKSLDRTHVHETGWAKANRDFHGVTLGMRPFILKHYDDPKLQEAAFDGLTLALMAIAHFEDIKHLTAILNGLTDTQPKD